MPIIPTAPLHQGCRAIQVMTSRASSCSCCRYSSCRIPSDSPEPLISTIYKYYIAYRLLTEREAKATKAKTATAEKLNAGE